MTQKLKPMSEAPKNGEVVLVLGEVFPESKPKFYTAFFGVSKNYYQKRDFGKIGWFVDGSMYEDTGVLNEVQNPLGWIELPEIETEDLEGKE